MTSPTGDPNNSIRTQLDFNVQGAKESAQQVDQLSGSMRTFANTAQKTQQSVRGGSAAGGIGAGATVPTFLQFSVFPFAGLAQQLGAGGLAQGLYGAGNIAGIVDALRVVPAQLARLSEGLVKMGGIFGNLASLGIAAETALLGTATGLGAILAVALPLVLIVGGIALAIKHFSDEAEASQKRIEATANALSDVAEASSKLTIPDVEKNISGIQKSINAAQALIDTLNSFSEEARRPLTPEEQAQFTTPAEQMDLAQRIVDDINQRLTEATGGLATTVGDVPGIIESLQGDIDKWMIDLQKQGLLLNSPIVLQNTAEEANAKAAQEEAKFHAERLDSLIDLNTQIRGLTKQQIGEQIQSLEEQRQSILKYYDAATDEEKKALDQRLVILSEGLEALTTAQQNFGIGDVFRVGQQAFEDFFTKVKDMAVEFARQTQRILEERVIAATQEVEDFSIRRLRTLRDYARQQETQDIQDSRRQEQLATEQVRQQEDLADRIRKIMRDLADELDDAIGFRDALGYVQAQKRARRQLDELKQDEEVSEKRRKEDLEREDRYRQEDRQRALQDFRIRLADEDSDRALRLQRLNQQQQREDVLRQQDYNYRYQALYQQVSRETGLYDVLRNTVMFSLDSAAGSVSLFVARVLNSMSQLNTSPQATQAINQAVNQQVYSLFGTPYNFP